MGMKLAKYTCSFIAISILFAIFIASANLYAQTSDKDRETYYFKKILKNEIDALKYQLKQKEKECQKLQDKQEELSKQLSLKANQLYHKKTPPVFQREQERLSGVAPAEKTSSQAKDLERQIEELKQVLKKQKESYEQLLAQKDMGYELKISENDNQYKTNLEKLKKEKQACEQMFLHKDKEHELKMWEKDKQHKLALANLEKKMLFENKENAKKLRQKTKELKLFHAQSKTQEKVLLDSVAEEKAKFKQKFEDAQKKFNNESKVMEASLVQLRDYLAKFKAELRRKTVILKEKDDQISVLNKKIALFSGEEIEYQKKAVEIMGGELENAKNENKRLRKELQDLTVELAQREDDLESKLEEQKDSIQEVQEQSEVDLVSESFIWEKKIQILNNKHEKQLETMKRNYEKVVERIKSQLERVTDKLRDKVSENAELKSKLKK